MTAIGSIDDIPIGAGLAYAVDGVQVAVFRLRNGDVRAVGAVCPHRGGPLADGLADDAVVVCPLHGNTFDLSTGCELTAGELTVPTYPVSVDAHGTISVSVGQPVPG